MLLNLQSKVILFCTPPKLSQTIKLSIRSIHPPFSSTASFLHLYSIRPYMTVSKPLINDFSRALGNPPPRTNIHHKYCPIQTWTETWWRCVTRTKLRQMLYKYLLEPEQSQTICIVSCINLQAFTNGCILSRTTTTWYLGTNIPTTTTASDMSKVDQQ